jgi:DNA-binding IclR family transcriptional regulator
MKRAEIPAAVLQFVLKRIDTVTALEALLIMSAEESRQWSVDEIAARIYVAKPSAAAVLHALQAQRLISGDAAGTSFRFDPASEEERQTILHTATAYRTHLIAIATLIHKKASGPVQEFARAFDFKKDE